MPPILHLVRLGTHAERDYLLRGSEWFEGLVVNANLVEATKAATAVFVISLGKPYYIDPVTYAFALDPRLLHTERPNKDGRPRVRATFRSLAQLYGLPIGDELGLRPISPADFGAAGRAESFTEAVLAYQALTLPNVLAANADFATAGGDALNVAEPTRLIPPYLVEDGSPGTRELNLEFIRAAEQQVGAAAISPVVAYDSRRMNTDSVKAMAQAYSFDSGQCWLWPTDLDEHFASQDALNAYADLVRALSGEGRSPIAAYGGVFAMLLAFRGMRGLTHGLGYGDKRDLEPVAGGGLPPARYYFRPVRDGIGMGDLAVVAYGLQDEDFRRRICDCTICLGLLAKGGVKNLIAAFNETEPRESPVRGIVEVPTARVYRMARFHFLESRASEVAEVTNAASFEAISGPLAADAAWAAERLGRRAVSHIDRWIDAANPSRP